MDNSCSPVWPLGETAEICVHPGAFRHTYDDVWGAIERHVPPPQERGAGFFKAPRTISFLLLTCDKRLAGQSYAFGKTKKVEVRAVYTDDPVVRAAFDAASSAAGVKYALALVNVYHLTDPDKNPSRQTLGWHMDDEPEIDQRFPITSISLTKDPAFERRLGWYAERGPASGRSGTVILGSGDVAVGAFGSHMHCVRPRLKNVSPCPQIVFTMRKMTFEPQDACPKRERDGGERSGRPSKQTRREPLTRQRADAVAEVRRLAQAAEYRRVMRAVGGSFTDAEFRELPTFLTLRRGRTIVSAALDTLLVQDNAGIWERDDCVGSAFGRRLARVMERGCASE